MPFKLNQNRRRHIPRQRRRVLHNMVELIEGGIADGEFKPVNASVTAFAILGMCN